MSYLIRAKKIPTVGTFALVDTPEQMADFVAPLWRADSTTRIYLFELTTSPVPKPLAIFAPSIVPEVENVATYYVETNGGTPLFSFSFFIDPEAVPAP